MNEHDMLMIALGAIGATLFWMGIGILMKGQQDANANRNSGYDPENTEVES